MLSRLSQVSRHLSSPTTTSPPLAASTARAALSRTKKMALPSDQSSRMIRTAACLIIGDEVLGGKTVDTNSSFMAKWCFGLGIDLKRIEVIEDEEGEIIEAVRRMSHRYDFVVTSGGIGPTHDDITYHSVAKAFNLPLVLHKQALERMKRLSKPHPAQPNFAWDVDSPALRARLRMIQLPTDPAADPAAQVVFPHEDLWVPVAVVNGNIHILPGVPLLFKRLLDGLRPHIIHRLLDPDGKGSFRVIISTPLPESAVAEYLTALAARVEPKGVKVGSYPRWGRKQNTVTLVGKYSDQAFIESLVDEVEANVQGKRVQSESELDVDEPETAGKS